MNEIAWKNIQDEKERLQPTPPIGHTVQWYQAGNRAAIYAGQVTGIEGPGRIKVQVAVIQAVPQHKAACYHVSHWQHDKPDNSTTKAGGSWDYVPYTKIPKEHYELHETELAKREAGLMAAEEAERKAKEDFAKKQSERLADRKKIKSPEPLPAAV